MKHNINELPRIISHFVLILLFVFLSVFPSFASDWPQFKHSANRQGCDLSEQVTLPAKLCSWVDFGSPIRASAAIVNGKAYAVSTLGVLARVDLATNHVDWSFKIGGVNNESSPAVENGRVYVGSTAGSFYVLDAQTGEQIKKYQAAGAVLASPLIFKGSVYFGDCGGKFHALDMDGNLKWICSAADQILYGAAADSNWIIFTSGLGYVYWVRDLGTRCDTANICHYDAMAAVPFGSPGYGGGAVTASPVIWKDRVFVGFAVQEEIGAIYGFKLSGSGMDTCIDRYPQTVHNSFSVDTESNILFVPSTYAGLYSKNSTGWTTAYLEEPPSGCLGVNSSPAVIKNCVIFGEEQGKLHFCAKDSVGNWSGAKYQYNLASAHSFWSYTLPSGKAIEASPAVSGGKVVVGSFDGCLYGFWDGTAVTAPVKVDTTLGTSVSSKTMAQLGAWTLTAFPNPAAGNLVCVKLSGIHSKATISIYEVSGALVRKFALKGTGHDNVDWDMKDFNGRALPSGAYFARVSDNAGRNMRTFNIQVVR